MRPQAPRSSSSRGRFLAKRPGAPQRATAPSRLAELALTASGGRRSGSAPAGRSARCRSHTRSHRTRGFSGFAVLPGVTRPLRRAARTRLPRGRNTGAAGARLRLCRPGHRNARRAKQLRHISAARTRVPSKEGEDRSGRCGLAPGTVVALRPDRLATMRGANDLHLGEPASCPALKARRFEIVELAPECSFDALPVMDRERGGDGCDRHLVPPGLT